MHRGWRRPACGPRSSSRSSSAVLLLAVTFAVPDTQATIDTANILPIVPFIWTESMSQRGPSVFCSSVRRPVLLRDGLDHVRVADDLRVLARSRRPGPSALASSGRNRVPRSVARSSCFWRRRDLMVPAIWNYFIGYAVGTAIAVIGLYIAFILPVILRYRMKRRVPATAPGRSASTTSGSTRSRSCGSSSSASSS